VVILGSSGTGGSRPMTTCSRRRKRLCCPRRALRRPLCRNRAHLGVEVEVGLWADGVGHGVRCASAGARLDRIPKRDQRRHFNAQRDLDRVQNRWVRSPTRSARHGALVLVDSVSVWRRASSRWMRGLRRRRGRVAKKRSRAPGISMVAISPRAWEKMATANAPGYYFDLRKARESQRSVRRPRRRRYRSVSRWTLRSIATPRRAPPTCGRHHAYTGRHSSPRRKRSVSSCSRSPGAIGESRDQVPAVSTATRSARRCASSAATCSGRPSTPRGDDRAHRDDGDTRRRCAGMLVHSK